MQMLIAFTHDAGSISPVAPIRGSFNEVLNRRLSYSVARPRENSGTGKGSTSQENKCPY